MLLIRFILLGLASLNSTWALANFLSEYLRFVIQTFDPLHHTMPFDSTMLIAWLTIAAASGAGTFVLFYASYKQGRRGTKIITWPPLPHLHQQEPAMAA